jgi:hypothetical protein
VDEELEVSEDEEQDDDYGSLIEESIKEFSMSLTKDQLELLDQLNAEAD